MKEEEHKSKSVLESDRTGGVKTILPPILSSASCPPIFSQPSNLFLSFSCGEVHFCLHPKKK